MMSSSFSPPASVGRLSQSSRAMVTSPHTLASAAGLEVLRSGGNAIEAAIATATTLSVTYPHFNGLGGDAFWVIAEPNGEVRTLSGIGQAAANVSDYPLGEGRSLPQRGAASALTTAAAVDTWGQAFDISQHQWQGTVSWSSLFQQAIEFAETGFPVSASQLFWHQFRRDELDALPNFRAAFAPAGRIPSVGETFIQLHLARSLKEIALHGPRACYEGELAERIAKGLAAAGSPLTFADLAKTRARNDSPISVKYRDGELFTIAPPTQGVTTLQIMGILDRFDFSTIAEGSADYYHLLVEAVKLAFIDRDECISDPDFNAVPIARLLAASTLDEHAGRIDMHRARPWPNVFQQGDTAFIGVADAQGRTVSLLQTVYYDWGSGIVVGDTGILWHNRGASFSLDPQHRNVLQPGKRPFHTLNPGVYLREGRPVLAYGTQGADGQPQTLAAILTRLIDYGMDPLTTLRRPRFLLGRTFSDSRDTLKLEADAGDEVFAELAARGHEISAIPALSPLAGQPGVIQVAPTGTLYGAHDPRSDGLALAL